MDSHHSPPIPPAQTTTRGATTRDSARASKNPQGPMRQVTVEGVDFVVDIQVTSQLNFNYVGDTL